MSLDVVRSAGETATPDTNVTFLLLGDGDFSFSFDLARYLFENLCLKNSGAVSSENSPRKRGIEILHRASQVKLIATGIDSAQEVKEKYKDSDFLTTNLRNVGRSGGDLMHVKFQVEIHHDVNAILSLSKGDRNVNNHLTATFVIFNHPHLGIEDAALHAQFLCHLFHSIVNGWMQEEGRFFLTLIVGQWERWEGAASCVKCGLELVDRSLFFGPVLKEKTYYQQRRHQTGKSFAARAESGSETFTFRRKTARPDGALNQPVWFAMNTTKQISQNSATDQALAEKFTCPHCENSFREERSLKNHIRSKHDGGSNKRKLEAINCPECTRFFSSDTGLQDHLLAKHSALHSQIKPDWYTTVAGRQSGSQPTSSFTCRVCGASEKTEIDHMRYFIPILDRKSSDAVNTFQCELCMKTFREKRAQLQHENFCSAKQQQQQQKEHQAPRTDESLVLSESPL
mmetsp:Transcript_16224/g.21228  ORF Transcript_16224/g.21228 Transcript_16224/m.21228 type:complete len:456 (-) Transcript_16224:13-1380(-)